MTLSTTRYARGNRTVFDIPFTWNRIEFEATRVQCRQARKLIQMSINVQFEKQFRSVCLKNVEIEKKIIESNERVIKCNEKSRVLDSLVEMTSESLTHYFDKRMEHVRNRVQEHCNAIQVIVSQEAEHWKEIHQATDDENPLIPRDVRSPAEPKSPLTADEVVENPSKSMDATLQLTEMIQKSDLQSEHPATAPPTPVEVEPPFHVEDSVSMKQNRFNSLVLPLSAGRQTLPVVDTTFVVKPEEPNKGDTCPNHEQNRSYRATAAVCLHLSTPEAEPSPIYSQPKIPPPLYFSPTLLEEEPELINTVLSPVDQNRANPRKTTAATRRFGQTFVLDNIKTEKANDVENTHPKILDDMLPSVDTKPQSPGISNDDDIQTHPKSILVQKSRTIKKVETKPIVVVSSRITRSATKGNIEQTRKPSPPELQNVTRRVTRKRKQSISNESDQKPIATASVTRRPKKPKSQKKTMKNIVNEDPSPILTIDRLKHYGTRFSNRSHRFNNLTLTGESDDENNETRYTLIRQTPTTIGIKTRLRAGDSSHHTIDDEIEPILILPRKNSKQRIQSMATKKHRKK